MRNSRHFNRNWQSLTQDVFADCELLDPEELLTFESTYLNKESNWSLTYQDLKVHTLSITPCEESSLQEEPGLLLNVTQSTTIVEYESTEETKDDSTNIIHLQK